MKISEQLVVVTGGARGLGTAIVRAVHREGGKVVINYRRSAAAAERLAAELGGRAWAIAADVTDAGQVRRMMAGAEELAGQPVVSVVNNALPDFLFNGDNRTTLEAMDWAALAAQIEGAVRGTLNTVQAALPAMKACGFGRVVNIGTDLFQSPVVPYHDYIAAKGALLALTRTAAQELGPHGITVNMLSGGLLRTTDASAATPESVFDFIAGVTPLRRVTTVEEFADTVLFFLSPWSRAVSGQNLLVDGGLVKN
ncbi:MAG: 3-oxoacyl-ACP reductase [Chthoniobacterales bacterium]